MGDYVPRLVDPLLDALFQDLPALGITGPRATGKTTTAARLVKDVVHLDDELVGGLFAANPDAALGQVREPALLDEWQAQPGVLGAVKRSVDAEPRPGRFILTGSAGIDLTTRQWPATGRVVNVPLFGLTVREILSRPGELFSDRLAAASLDALRPAHGLTDAPTIVDYIRWATTGGFPDSVLARSDLARLHWLADYVEHLLQRDVFLLDIQPDTRRLRAYLTALATNTANVVEAQTLFQAAGISRKTAAAYDDILQRLYVLDLVPAWWTSRLSRLTQIPKRHVIDPALVPAVLRLDSAGILRNARLVGQLLETFVAAQIRSELAASRTRPTLYHLREQAGRHEVDLVLEYPLGQVAGIEVKAAGTVDESDARHLLWLRDKLGDDFLGGVVLHTGPGSTTLSDRVYAAPISTIWA
ncbi:MAG: ATP-binding protein [Propionibacteriaceae bacterium]|nr:ATP-binding protein [Propionibacteriaceae bacterium]